MKSRGGEGRGGKIERNIIVSNNTTSSFSTSHQCILFPGTVSDKLAH